MFFFPHILTNKIENLLIVQKQFMHYQRKYVKGFFVKKFL
jgi:hypothetical protein